MIQENFVQLVDDNTIPATKPRRWSLRVHEFLADRTNGRSYATVLRPSIAVTVVVVCG